MKRTPIRPDFSMIPEVFHPLLAGCPVFDSSCSKEAKVYYLDRDGGLFLKAAPQGTLQQEAQMNAFFHSKGLGPEVLQYLPAERDWLLTRQVPGEDCTHSMYLSDPKRLCDTTATLLRQLHETDFTGCPIMDRNETYLRTAAQGMLKGSYEEDLFPGHWGFSGPQEAWETIEACKHLLKPNALLHGDYCLPNTLLDNWRLSGFIDLGNGGVGDRHIDVFWGSWTLFFNLKTEDYCERFLDVYGRDCIEPELLRAVAAMEIFR